MDETTSSPTAVQPPTPKKTVRASVAFAESHLPPPPMLIIQSSTATFSRQGSQSSGLEKSGLLSPTNFFAVLSPKGTADESLAPLRRRPQTSSSTSSNSTFSSPPTSAASNRHVISAQTSALPGEDEAASEEARWHWLHEPHERVLSKSLPEPWDQEALSPLELFEKQVVRVHDRGLLVPFISGGQLRNQERAAASQSDDRSLTLRLRRERKRTAQDEARQRHSVKLSDIAFPPLLRSNPFRVEEGKTAMDSEETSEAKTRTTPDLLQSSVHEVSLLHERHTYKIPWDFALRMGLREYSSEDFDKAVHYFNLMSPLVGSGIKHMLMGTANFKAGHYVAAEHDFTLALQRTSGPGHGGGKEDPFVYYNRGVTRAQIGDTGGALRDLDTAVYLNPQERSFYHSRGLLYRRLGDYTAAEREFSLALAGVPKQPSEATGPRLPSRVVGEYVATAAGRRNQAMIEALCSACQSKPWLRTLPAPLLRASWQHWQLHAFTTSQRVPVAGDRASPGWQGNGGGTPGPLHRALASGESESRSSSVVSPSENSPSSVSDEVVWCVWSGYVTQRLPVESLQHFASLKPASVRPSAVSKYEVITMELRAGAVFGACVDPRIRGRYCYAAEEATELLAIPRSVFMSEGLEAEWLKSFRHRYDFFTQLPCFQGVMAEHELMALAADVEEMHVSENQAVVRQGEPANAMYFIARGMATATRLLHPEAGPWKDKRMNVGTYTRNRVIGEETISAPKMGAGANVYRLTVTSETEMVLFRVDISQVYFPSWTPELCRRLREHMGLQSLVSQDGYLLQRAIDVEQWHVLRHRVLVGRKHGVLKGRGGGNGKGVAKIDAGMAGA